MKFLKLLTELSGFSETLFSLVLVFVVIIVVVIRKSNCSTLLSSVLVYACAPSITMKGIFLLRLSNMFWFSCYTTTLQERAGHVSIKHGWRLSRFLTDFSAVFSGN